MSNKEQIWRFLLSKIGNENGVAGVMGNLLAESNLRPDNLQNSYEKSLGMTDAEYTAAVDSGEYPEEAFVNDSAGYGLAQWTYWSRKRELYQYCKRQGRSIGDLQAQLEFLWMELAGYRSIVDTLTNAETVREASDAFMLGFEKPADQSEENRATRAEYGRGFLDEFHGKQSGQVLTIYRRYFYQSDCYNAGNEITPCGVQVHSTGANNPYLRRYVQPDDGRIGRNVNGNDHNHSGGNVCASAYIGKQADGTVAVYQALPWTYRCWLSGSGSKGNANRLGYIGFEICEDGLTDRQYFEQAVMGQAVLLTAYLCQEYQIPVERVHDHRELHDLGLASNHADITHWLGKFGLKMADFRAAVASAMEEGISVTYVDCDAEKGLYDAKTVNPGSYLNLRSGPGTNYAAVAHIPRGSIVLVLDDSNWGWWQVSYQGQAGYCMAKYLERLDDPEMPEETPEEIPETPEEPEEPAAVPDAVTIPRALALQLYAVLGDQLIVDTRSGNVSNIDYQ